MFAGTYKQAVAQAKANANQTGVPWVLYTDTAQNYRVCRQSQAPSKEQWLNVYLPEETKQ